MCPRKEEEALRLFWGSGLCCANAMIFCCASFAMLLLVSLQRRRLEADALEAAFNVDAIL
jgi:hypothetical protein